MNHTLPLSNGRGKRELGSAPHARVRVVNVFDGVWMFLCHQFHSSRTRHGGIDIAQWVLVALYGLVASKAMQHDLQEFGTDQRMASFLISAMSDPKGSRATTQHRASTTKKAPKRSLLHRLTTPSYGGVLTAMTPAAQRRKLEEMMKDMGYADEDDAEQKEEEKPKKIESKANDEPAKPEAK